MFSPISDYGVIGNLRTAALVNRNGNIDWFCGPNFDSGPVWFPLLDPEKGGAFRIVAEGLQPISRRYLENTAVLQSRCRTETGTFSITDFMPVLDAGFAGEHVDLTQICRSVQCDSGTVDLVFEVQPSFAFAGESSTVRPRIEHSVARFDHDGRELTVQAEGSELTFETKLRITRKLSKGDRCNILITLSEPAGLTRFGSHDFKHLESKTINFWRNWANQIHYDGPYRQQVARSAITLKLLQFSATGAIIAAPTTSLPERIGDKFNWDYRFTWLRDAAFTAVALLSLDLSGEAFGFLKFVHGCIAGRDQIHTLYTIFGKVPEKERELNNLSGYQNSQPVRIGNAAASQLQLDIFGELLHCISLLASHSKLRSSRLQFHRDLWPTIQAAADAVCENWQKPDKGIWETRGKAERFVYSQGMCIVALQRAIELGEQHEENVPSSWRETLKHIQSDFENRAFNPQLEAYAQAYGSDQLDASVLRLPLLGVLHASDGRVQKTIEAIQQSLTRNGFVLRNKNLDGGKAGEGAFLPCSFWLVNNIALAGRTEEAQQLFERLLGCASDLGLYSEEYDPEHRSMLGNFPQAFTHVALINSAVELAIATQQHRSEAHQIVQNKPAQGGQRPAS